MLYYILYIFPSGHKNQKQLNFGAPGPWGKSLGPKGPQGKKIGYGRAGGTQFFFPGGPWGQKFFAPGPAGRGPLLSSVLLAPRLQKEGATTFGTVGFEPRAVPPLKPC